MTLASNRDDSFQVLTFHGLGPLPDRVSEGERGVWIEAAVFEDVLDRLQDVPGVRLTFDDGNVSDVEVALRGLVDRGLVAEFFVVVDRIGAPGYLSRSQLAELLGAGMTVGSHGMFHREWRGLSDGDLAVETVEAHRRLEDTIARPVRSAAFPFGAYDRRVLAAARKLGYATVYTCDPGRARSGRWLQPRTTVRRGQTAGDVRALARDPGTWLGRTKDALRTSAKSLR